MTSSFKKRIKSQDVFGHPIRLTFNGVDAHQTTLGGFLSLLMNIALVSLFFLKLRLMITYSSDTVSVYSNKLDFEQLGNITLGVEQEFMPFLVIKDSRTFPPTNIEFHHEHYSKFIQPRIRSVDKRGG